MLELAFLGDIGTQFTQGLVAGFGSIWIAERGEVARLMDGDTPS
jgi:hypothetical protein